MSDWPRRTTARARRDRRWRLAFFKGYAEAASLGRWRDARPVLSNFAAPPAPPGLELAPFRHLDMFLPGLDVEEVDETNYRDAALDARPVVFLFCFLILPRPPGLDRNTKFRFDADTPPFKPLVVAPMSINDALSRDSAELTDRVLSSLLSPTSGKPVRKRNASIVDRAFFENVTAQAVEE